MLKFLRLLLIILLFSQVCCEPKPMTYGIITIQKIAIEPGHYYYLCPNEAILTNTNESNIITFTVEIKSRNSGSKRSKILTLLPGATKFISSSCGLVFTIKGAFYEKASSKRVENN